jgi:elongation factor P
MQNILILHSLIILNVDRTAFFHTIPQIMLEYSEIKPGKYIVWQNEPYEVLESHVARTQQRKPQNQTKVRNLISGRITPATFHASDKVSEADISKRTIKFIYAGKGQLCFSEIKDPSNRFFLDESIVGNQVRFLKANTEVDALIFTNDDDEEKIIGLKLPIKMDFLVKEAPPSIKGDTASGGGKAVVLETGATVTAPLFINAGDIIRINTDTGLYTERVEKN